MRNISVKTSPPTFLVTHSVALVSPFRTHLADGPLRVVRCHSVSPARLALSINGRRTGIEPPAQHKSPPARWTRAAGLGKRRGVHVEGHSPRCCLCGSPDLARRCAAAPAARGRRPSWPLVRQGRPSWRSDGRPPGCDADDINLPLAGVGATCHADPCVWPTGRVRVHSPVDIRLEWRAPPSRWSRLQRKRAIPARRRSRRRSLRFQDDRIEPCHSTPASRRMRLPKPPGVLLHVDRPPGVAFRKCGRFRSPVATFPGPDLDEHCQPSTCGSPRPRSPRDRKPTARFRQCGRCWSGSMGSIPLCGRACDRPQFLDGVARVKW